MQGWDSFRFPPLNIVRECEEQRECPSDDYGAQAPRRIGIGFFEGSEA